MNGDRIRQLTAEFVGTALLLAAVVGSGIMGERLAAGNVAVTLLANTLATGAALLALILTFGPVSGAHFNPAVTLADASRSGVTWRAVPGYVGAQLAGAVGGVWTAHAMFGESILMLSTHARSGCAQRLSEFVATFGLVAVISACSRRRVEFVPFAVAAYITTTLAICMVCGGPASHTQRLVASKERVLVGASGTYEARCRHCFDPTLGSGTPESA